MRRDLLPGAYIDELELLHDDADPKHTYCSA